jgi:peptidoglycan/xylan/chitin deacetylase (PgdA/CDA1 family)
LGSRREAKRIGVMIVVATAVGVAAPAHGKLLVRDNRDAAGPVEILRVKPRQSGPLLRMTISTAAPAPFRELSRQPRLSEPGLSRYLCLRLGQRAARLLCLAATADGRPAAFAGRIGDSGQIPRLQRAPDLRVRRDGSTRVEIRGSLRAFQLRPRRVRLTGRSDWTGEPCQPVPQPPRGAAPEEPPPAPAADLCADRAPDGGWTRMRLVRPRIVGCTRDEHRVVHHGSRGKREVALTFDDGPGPYTDDVLRVLRERDVRATFFLVGQNVAAHTELVRRELRAGHELGNHSSTHRAYPSYSDLRATSARIKRATGFEPCTFRPPYGAMSQSTISAAWDLGTSSILWDVDPADWGQPGSGVIEDRVVANARAGSIVVMHDGGGARAQTVAALPGIIARLRDRGFELVTVSKLLDGRPIWKP